MNERSLQSIKDHLQKRDAQERIEQHIRRGRSEATVTIGRAARLFNFSENQLRDWEARGLLNPLRSKDTTGQRQYSLAELDKLAVIRELMDAGYSPGEVPPNVDDIWYSILPFSKQQERSSKVGRQEIEHLYIDQRIERDYGDIFWRYYAFQALRFSLMMIAEDTPDTSVGLVLPLHQHVTHDSVRHPSDLANIGESLIGWLRQDLSFSAFLDSAPSFEYPTDFRVGPLQLVDEGAPKDGTLIVVQRKAKSLTLSKPFVETIRRLLAPLYNVPLENWRSYFGQGMRDFFYEAADFSGSTSPTILKGLADIIVLLGSQEEDGQNRWRFCCILLPENPTLPIQQRSLVVRAQSKYSPHKVGSTTISPGKFVDSLCVRAFQSGRIAYRREVSDSDSTIAFRELEGPLRSAVAVPVGGETGQPLAVLYAVSNKVSAFSEDDLRIIRIISRMIEDLLMAYQTHQQVTVRLETLILKPSIVDELFEVFLSENDFIDDVETLLTGIKVRMDERGKRLHKNDNASISDHETGSQPEHFWEEVVSFIAVDIDNLSAIASKYGDRMTRNLSRMIGLRIREMMQALITKDTDCKLYHIYADRFYLMLKGISLEQARTKAEAMRQALQDHISIEQPAPPARTIVLPDVTIRLGVISYTYSKLEENLESTFPVNIIPQVRGKIALALDVALNMGMDEGGNVVISWSRETGGYMRWSPTRTK
jgi:GGDEF domain-containing protein